MKILQDFSLTELKRELENIVEKMPRYRAEQIYKWANDYATFDEMTNLPLDLRETLKENYVDNPVKIERELISKDGTRKYTTEVIAEKVTFLSSKKPEETS